jgi:hypothetical protein
MNFYFHFRSRVAVAEVHLTVFSSIRLSTGRLGQGYRTPAATNSCYFKNIYRSYLQQIFGFQRTHPRIAGEYLASRRDADAAKTAHQILTFLVSIHHLNKYLQRDRLIPYYRRLCSKKWSYYWAMRRMFSVRICGDR